MTSETLHATIDVDEALDGLVEKVASDVGGRVVEGDDCPECGASKYIGFLELADYDGEPGLRLVTDCLNCGHSDTRNFFKSTNVEE